MIFYECSPHLRVPATDAVGKPRTIRVTTFHSRAVAKFRYQMQEAIDSGQPVIPIIVDSYGGEFYGVFAMADVIEAAKHHAQIATLAEGKAMSAGALILSSGDKGLRFVAPGATVMIHEGSGGTANKVADVLSHASELKRINDQYMRRLSKNAGRKPEFFTSLLRKLNNADTYMSPEMTVRSGIADHVGVPQLMIKVDVEYGFGVMGEEKEKPKMSRKRRK